MIMPMDDGSRCDCGRRAHAPPGGMTDEERAQVERLAVEFTRLLTEAIARAFRAAYGREEHPS